MREELLFKGEKSLELMVLKLGLRILSLDILKASIVDVTSLTDAASSVTQPSLLLTLLPSSSKDPCDYTGLTWVIKDNFPTSKFLT